jgi:N-acylglucosamine-6-phosphate 2-epimerase
LNNKSNLMQQTLLSEIRSKLVVSCQAEGNSPFNTPEALSLFAIAAKQGGAGGIRSEGVAKTRKIKESVSLPLIGLIKNYFPDGSVCITRSAAEVESLIGIGVEIIAIDGTFREVEGVSGPAFIQYCKQKYPSVSFIADIATIEEAIANREKGADAISTTLRGYTPETSNLLSAPFDFGFLKQLNERIKGFPIIAEGKIKDTTTVARIKKTGAWSIVVGSAITRPVLTTNEFVEAYK